MPALSLFQLTRRACVRNLHSIRDVGDLPYELVKPVLSKIENPDQLHVIEQNSPQIRGECGELWLGFIKRDIPNWESRRHEPANPANWWKVYRKLRKDVEQEIEQDQANLRAEMLALQEKKESMKTTQINAALDPARKRGKPQQRSSGILSLNTKKPVTGAQVISQARREAQESARRLGSNSVMGTPTHLLSNNGVKSIPKSLLQITPNPSPRPQASNPPVHRIIAPKRSVFTPNFLRKDRDALQGYDKALRDKAAKRKAVDEEQKEKQRRLDGITIESAATQSSTAPQTAPEPAKDVSILTVEAEQKSREPAAQTPHITSSALVRGSASKSPQPHPPTLKRKAPPNPLLKPKRPRPV